VETGKVSPGLLKELVLEYLGCERDEVLVPAAFGEDASVLDMGDNHIVISTDPITAAGADAGRLAVLVSCNDVAAAGAEPVGLLMTVIMPPHATPEDLKNIMEQANDAAREMSVEIIGGHTEVVPHVQQTILCSTVVGKAFPDVVHWPIRSGSARVGDVLVLTKSAGIEGSAILAADFADVLEDRGISRDVMQEAQKLGDNISVVEDSRVAAQAGARAMHDVTEGGVLGAVYEMLAAAGLGAVLYEDRIPVHACTREICAALDLDPLRLISSGALLIAADPEHKVAEALEESGIPAGEIGEITSDDSVVLRRALPGRGEMTEIVPPPGRDELWRAFARFRAEDD